MGEWYDGCISKIGQSVPGFFGCRLKGKGKQVEDLRDLVTVSRGALDYAACLRGMAATGFGDREGNLMWGA